MNGRIHAPSFLCDGCDQTESKLYREVKIHGPQGARRAFTLVELLIAISLIAVLVALGVPATERLVHKGRATHCLSNLRNLGGALQLYLNDHNNIMPTLVTARESKDSEEQAIDN